MLDTRKILGGEEAVSSQVLTYATTVNAIMRSRDFKRGVEEVRAGRPPDYDVFDDDLWAYERGRLWAAAAPKSMPVMAGRRVNPAAIDLFIRSVI